MNHVKSTKNAQNTVKSVNGRSSAISQYISPKFKRKRTDEAYDHRTLMGKKKRKLFSGGTDALSNNNNICYDKNVKGLMEAKEIADFNHVKIEQKEVGHLMGDIRGSSGEEEDFSDDTSRGKGEENDEDDDEEEEEAVEGPSVLDIGNNNLEGENDNEEESSDEESSSETDNDDSTSGEEDEDDEKKVNNLQKLPSKKDEDEEEDEFDEDSQRHPGNFSTHFIDIFLW